MAPLHAQTAYLPRCQRLEEEAERCAEWSFTSLIRHDYYDFGKSKREIARSRGVHRRVVRQAIESAVPPERNTPARVSPVMTDEVRAFIDKILKDDLKARKKQRHPARRIWQRVVDELGSTAAESTVRAYVAERKRQMGDAEVFILQHHRHLMFESSFTTLGIEGAHEKGGVEGEVGRFRRRWLTPVPKFDSFEQANDYLKACCIHDLDRWGRGPRPDRGRGGGVRG